MPTQLGVHGAALKLGADGVLLCSKAAGIAGLGDLFEAAGQLDVLAGQFAGTGRSASIARRAS